MNGSLFIKIYYYDVDVFYAIILTIARWIQQYMWNTTLFVNEFLPVFH